MSKMKQHNHSTLETLNAAFFEDGPTDSERRMATLESEVIALHAELEQHKKHLKTMKQILLTIHAYEKK